MIDGGTDQKYEGSSCSIFELGYWTGSTSRLSCTRCIATSLRGLATQMGCLVSLGASGLYTSSYLIAYAGTLVKVNTGTQMIHKLIAPAILI